MLSVIAVLLVLVVVLIYVTTRRCNVQHFDSVNGPDERGEVAASTRWIAYTPGCGRFRDRGMCTGLTSGAMPAIEQQAPPMCLLNYDSGCCRKGVPRGNLPP